MQARGPAGIDEPRLVAFARELARTRVTVVTPDIPELRRLEIAPALTDRVEQAAVSVATDESLAPTGRIGLMGISFSGGLAVVAAGRPRLRDHLSYVFALGGHDDLPRVLRYLSTGAEPAPPGTTARSRDGLGIRRLLPHLESLPDVPALSASRSPAPTVPVFLLHGSSDTVIPPAESEYLANRLRGRVRVRLLVTDLVCHAEAHERARATDLLRLAGFWGDMLAR